MFTNEKCCKILHFKVTEMRKSSFPSVQESAENLLIETEEDANETLCDTIVIKLESNFDDELLETHKLIGRKNDVGLQKTLRRRDLPKQDLPFICEICGIKFTVKSNLKRHEREIHFKEDRPRIICDQCGRSFSRSDALAKHQEMMHPEERFADWNSAPNGKNLECALCQKKFRWKASLIAHIRDKHKDCIDGENQCYECSLCRNKFLRRLQLINHIKKKHNRQPENCTNDRNYRCIECDRDFHSRDVVTQHYEEAHNIKMVYEKLEFESFKQFIKWRIQLQRNTVTQFVVSNSWKHSDCVTKRFFCHRSPKYKDQPDDRPRKRRTKLIGSKKLPGFCPATIVVKIKKSACVAEFQSTHVGHRTCSAEELRFMNLDEEHKKDIASKLLEGVPRKEIVETHRQSKSVNGNFDRLSLLKAKDVYNISKKIESPLSMVVPKDEEMSGKTYVVRNEDSVLYRKLAGQKCEEYGALNENDVVFVLMDQKQAETVRRFGRNIVAVSSAHGMPGCDFKLHTMFVIDINDEGIPVAFLLTNRKDQLVINIFFQSVRNRVGVVKTKTFIADVQLFYFYGWMTYMEYPKFHLYCTEHVNKAWLKNLFKISDVKQRSRISQQLHDLRQELNESLFQRKLEDFMLNKDKDMSRFLDYFRSTFYSYPARWAYCYRKYAGINTNPHAEVFLRELRVVVNGGRKIRTLYECLKCLEEYCVMKSNDKISQEVFSNSSSKLSSVRQIHSFAKECFINCEISIIHIDNATWEIASFQPLDNDTLETYVVEKLPFKDCQLYFDGSCQLFCDECKICFHEYRCSCSESAVDANMCKHIHALGIYLQTNESNENVISEDAVIPEEVPSPKEPAVPKEATVPVKTTSSGQNISNDIERVKTVLRNSFEKALELAQSEADLRELQDRFIRPLIRSQMGKQDDGKTESFPQCPGSSLSS